MIRKALLSGSFDPPTYGHDDLMRRASALYDEVYIVIFINDQKKNFFPIERRREWLSRLAAKYPNVKVDVDRGFVADYVKRHEIPVILRGVRNETDLRYEIPMAEYNLTHGGAETLLFYALEEFVNVSSSRVRKSLMEGTDEAEWLLSPEISREICENWRIFHEECQ